MYIGSLATVVDHNVAITSLAFVAVGIFWGRYLQLSKVQAFVCLGMSYLIQDISHIWFNEDTYQSHTWGGTNVASLSKLYEFSEHIYYMIPLSIWCINDSWKYTIVSLPIMTVLIGNYKLTSDSPVGPYGASVHTFITGNIDSESKSGTNKSFDKILAYMSGVTRDLKTTYHSWIDCAPEEVRSQRNSISKCVSNTIATRFGSEYIVSEIPGMDELYTIPSSLISGTSDQVFETEHIDGC